MWDGRPIWRTVWVPPAPKAGQKQLRTIVEVFCAFYVFISHSKLDGQAETNVDFVRPNVIGIKRDKVSHENLFSTRVRDDRFLIKSHRLQIIIIQVWVPRFVCRRSQGYSSGWNREKEKKRPVSATLFSNHKKRFRVWISPFLASSLRRSFTVYRLLFFNRCL